jgi:glycosyltransferase involved in cell wall biosynthesis
MSLALPRISIVTPSLNQAAFLERTIKSVLEQGYPNLEYIVMDGGSTDGSVDIIRKYADRLTYWVSQPDGGQSAAINAGWRRATGDVLAWLNSDDYYLPGTLHWAGEFFAKHVDTWLVYGRALLVDAYGTRLGTVGWPYHRRTMMFRRQCMPQPSAFLRRDALDAVGTLDPDLHYTMDLDLFLRVAGVSQPVHTRRALAVMTVHPGAKSSRGRASMARDRWRVRRRQARWHETPLVLIAQFISARLHASPRLLALADRMRSIEP